MPQNDYYQVLEVDEQANPKKIKEAYRKLAFKYHPDRNEGRSDSAEKMKWVNEAYAVLSNPTKRREYDLLRQQFGSSAHSQFRQNYSEQDIFSGSDINQVFEQMARAFGFRGFDEIFKEFYGQGYQRYEFRKPGFFARGYYFSGPRHTRRKNHAAFPLQENLGRITRFFLKQFSGIELPQSGADLNDAITLSVEHAYRGGPFAYYLKKKDKKLVVKIPAGVKHNQTIRLTGMGENGKGGANAGDLYLKVRIRRPLRERLKDFLSKSR